MQINFIDQCGAHLGVGQNTDKVANCDFKK